MSNIYVIKRDGKKVNFEKEKISNAIKKAMTQTGNSDQKLIHNVVSKIEQSLEKNNQKEIEIEKIQDMVEEILMKSNRTDVAREYIRYRYKKNEERFHKNKLFVFGSQIIDGSNQEIIKENANLNGESFSGKMNKFGAEYSKSFSKEFIIPDKIKKAIDEGWIYIHDLDHYALGTHNCIFVPFDKLLEKGFQVSDKGSVRTPNSISTAMAQVAIIFQCQQNSQYGGLGASKFDWDLAPYVNKSFKKHFKKGQKYFDECKNIEDEAIHFESVSLKKGCPRTYAYAHEETVTEVYQSAESLIHNLNTMASRAGGQVPFTSITFGLCTSPEGRLISNAMLEASIKGLGHGETAIFPQLIFQCKKGVNQDVNDPNYDLFLKAIECSSKRLFPNFINVDASFNLQYYDPSNPDTAVASMGCRTRSIVNRHSEEVYQSGKGNISFNSINLPKLGIEYGILQKQNIEAFWSKLDGLLELTLQALLHRYNIQIKQSAKASDFMMQNGVWKDGEKLNPNERVGELLKHGSLSIGFVGLAECLKALFGTHHGEDSEVWDFGYHVIKHIRNFCDENSEKLNMNITCFASPAESLCGTFAKINKAQYGSIKDVSDRDYITNSFHIPVYYSIKAHQKIELEAPFHELCNGGHISYVELDGNARNNQEAFKKIVQYAFSQNMGYFSINHPVDKCQSCNYDGVIESECPVCGESDPEKIYKIRRVTGYLTGNVNRFNPAKQAEERDRVKHFTFKDFGSC